MFAMATTSLIALTGCATGAAGSQKFQPDHVAAAPADRALVYVYRQNAQPTMWSATVSADGHDIAALAQGTYTQIAVAEGTRHFIAHWASLSGQKDSSIDLDVKPGQTYFIELTGQSLMTGVSTNTMGVVMHTKVGSGMVQHGSEAKDVMATCCSLVPAN